MCQLIVACIGTHGTVRTLLCKGLGLGAGGHEEEGEGGVEQGCCASRDTVLNSSKSR